MDVAATVAAALIGALVGSLGAVLLEAKLRREADTTDRREALVRRYLFQLQDAAEFLFFRLYNINFRQGRQVMGDDYYEITTLYALGRVLAIERILALDGVYPELEAYSPQLGGFLKGNRIDSKLAGAEFYQYHRLALAEAMIEREGERFRASTFVEFRRRYKEGAGEEREWLAPALEGIKALDKEALEELMVSLERIAKRLEVETRLPTAVDTIVRPRTRHAAVTGQQGGRRPVRTRGLRGE